MNNPTEQPDVNFRYDKFMYDSTDPNKFTCLIIEYYIHITDKPTDWKQKTIMADFFTEKITAGYDGEFTIYNIIEHPDAEWVFCFFVYYHNLKDFQRMCIDVEDLIIHDYDDSRQQFLKNLKDLNIE